MSGRIHFRYRDALGAMAGHMRWRYEIITEDQILPLIKELDRKGFDEFCIRKLGTLESWIELMPVTKEDFHPPKRDIPDVNHDRERLGRTIFWED